MRCDYFPSWCYYFLFFTYFPQFTSLKPASISVVQVHKSSFAKACSSASMVQWRASNEARDDIFGKLVFNNGHWWSLMIIYQLWLSTMVYENLCSWWWLFTVIITVIVIITMSIMFILSVHRHNQCLYHRCHKHNSSNDHHHHCQFFFRKSSSWIFLIL